MQDVVTPAVSSALQSAQVARDLSLSAENKKILQAEAKKRRFESEAAKYLANSAKSRARIEKERATRIEDYGESFTGQNISSFESMFMRAWNKIKGAWGDLSEGPLEVPIYPGSQPGGLKPGDYASPEGGYQ